MAKELPFPNSALTSILPVSGGPGATRHGGPFFTAPGKTAQSGQNNNLSVSRCRNGIGRSTAGSSERKDPLTGGAGGTGRKGPFPLCPACGLGLDNSGA